MADTYVRANNTSPGRSGDGTAVQLRGLRDGTGLFADQSFALGLEGKIFVANGGSGTAPVAFAGAFDADGPDFVIDVPTGTTIVPLEIRVHYESVGTTLLQETFASISATLGAVTAGTSVIPVNLNIASGAGSGCTVSAAVDAMGATAQTGSKYEFWRRGFQLAEDMAATEPGWPERSWVWSAKQDGVYPLIQGNGSMFIHAAAQAGTGFITVIYAEFATNQVL